jgi:hypothetical protein
MSTKTTFKRIALVTVAALGFGLLSSVTYTASAVSTGLVASVGPNGQTSVTVVGGTNSTTGVLIRLDVTNNDTATPGLGLGESITASVTGVPTTVNASKTVANNGGAFTDSATGWSAGAGVNDLIMLETAGQTTGSVNTTAATAVSAPTNWTRLATSVAANGFYLDSQTGLVSGTRMTMARAVDGVLGVHNDSMTNMDTNHELTAFNYTRSYYVTVHPRVSATVIDQGAYTISFQLTDANGVLRSTKTVTVDFVSSALKADASIALATQGTFLANTAVATYDTAAATWAKLTLTNRSGGLVRTNTGAPAAPSVTLQSATTLAPTYVDSSATVTPSDNGTYGQDHGSNSLTSPGNGTNRANDGVYGIAFTAPERSNTTTGLAYQLWAGYGNATIATAAITVYGATVAGGLTANPALTTVVATASGMSSTDEATFTLSAAKNYNVPVTTKTATLKFTVLSAAATPVGGALITVTPTWSGPAGTAEVTPATSTTGTVYTTDALGNFSVTVTNSAPIDSAKVTLVLSGAAAFGAGTNTVSVTFQAPVATTISVSDPVSGISVLTGSTNVVTVLVRDQFRKAVAGQAVTVSVTQTPAVVSTTVITPIITGAAGTATYSFTPAAATTSAVLSFNTTPTAVTAVTNTYTYVATLPVVATLTAYHGYDWDTAATLTPSTGIYTTASGTTRLTMVDARNISKATTAAADTDDANDQIALLFTGLTSAGVSATGASVTVTAGEGGWILSSSFLPVKSRTYAIGATGTAVINVLATGTGAITFTATSGTVTATASMWVAPRVNTQNSNTAGRFVTVTSAKTGTANGTGTPVTVAVTDRYGNPVSGVALNVVASGVGSFMGGATTQSFTTDASGTYTFLANTSVSDGGVAKFTATTGTVGSFDSLAGYVGSTEVDATLAAGNSSASAEITFAAGASATDVAQAATDAAAEATDAANAATDAANAAAEAADAATAAAQDAADAVAALSTQVSEMVNALKKQITALTNLVIKIQKKVKA